MIDGRVLDKPVDHATWGSLRALYEWLKPATPSPYLPSSPASAPDRGDVPARIDADLVAARRAYAEHLGASLEGRTTGEIANAPYQAVVKVDADRLRDNPPSRETDPLHRPVRRGAVPRPSRFSRLTPRDPADAARVPADRRPPRVVIPVPPTIRGEVPSVASEMTTA
jgi:hypothetical protein